MWRAASGPDVVAVEAMKKCLPSIGGSEAPLLVSGVLGVS